MFYLLGLLLAVACYYDIRWRRLPNWLCVAVLGLGVLHLLQTLPLSELLLTALVASVLLLFGIGLYALKWLGAGDIKYLVALCFWFKAEQVIEFVVVFTLLGGGLGLMALIHNRVRAPAIKNLPYGVAISGAAIWLLLIP